MKICSRCGKEKNIPKGTVCSACYKKPKTPIPPIEEVVHEALVDAGAISIPAPGIPKQWEPPEGAKWRDHGNLGRGYWVFPGRHLTGFVKTTKDDISDCVNDINCPSDNGTHAKRVPDQPKSLLPS